jgi:hypothetical protein
VRNTDKILSNYFATIPPIAPPKSTLLNAIIFSNERLIAALNADDILLNYFATIPPIAPPKSTLLNAIIFSNERLIPALNAVNKMFKIN